MRKRSRNLLLALGLVALAGASAVAAGAATDRSDRPQAEPPPKMSRQAAVARTQGQSARFKRVDRVEAKRMTWGEFHKAEGSGDVDFKSDQRVWVVAVSGEFVPNRMPRTAIPLKYQWGVVVYDADTEFPLATFAGPQGNWPPYFDRLPDRSQ